MNSLVERQIIFYYELGAMQHVSMCSNFPFLAPRFFWLTPNHSGFDHIHQKLWSKIKIMHCCLTCTSVFQLIFFQFFDVVNVTIIHPKENVKFGCRSHVYGKKKEKKGSFCIILSYLLEPIMKI